MIKKIFLASISLVALGFVLAGCDDETHADPSIVKSMNDQRSAQTKGMDAQKGANPGPPGPNNNPYGNPAPAPATK